MYSFLMFLLFLVFLVVVCNPELGSIVVSGPFRVTASQHRWRFIPSSRNQRGSDACEMPGVEVGSFASRYVLEKTQMDFAEKTRIGSMSCCISPRIQPNLLVCAVSHTEIMQN